MPFRVPKIRYVASEWLRRIPRSRGNSAMGHLFPKFWEGHHRLSVCRFESVFPKKLFPIEEREPPIRRCAYCTAIEQAWRADLHGAIFK